MENIRVCSIIGSSGMFKRNLIQTAARICGSLLIVAAVTSFYFFIFHQVNTTTVGFTFLVAILGIATAWGLPEAIVASVAAVLCFNLFFLPPLFTLVIADTQNWVALLSFLVTAVVASQLSASVKRRAMEAMRQREEVERLYELSRALMLVEKESAIGSQISQRIAQVFEATGIAVFDKEADQIYKTGRIENVSDIKLRDAALQSTAFHDSETNVSVLPLTLGREPIGSMAIQSGSTSDTAIQAIGNLAAIAMERSRTEATASRMEAARQNEAMKSMLLDALAHEFKTPLTSIKAATTTVLADTQFTGEYRELLSIVDEETDRLNNLVSDAIQMSRIEGGKFRLRRSVVSPRGVIDSVIGQMRARLEDRPIQRTVAEDAPNVAIDRDLMQLSLRQLVDNALKHAPGHSAIEVGAEVENSHLRFWVLDDGPGIAPAEAERVFERFYRGQLNRHAVPGSGIGLSVVREIARAHGGDTFVESSPGKGARFIIDLPLYTEELP